MNRRVAEKLNVAVLGSSSHGAVIADAIERSASAAPAGLPRWKTRASAESLPLQDSGQHRRRSRPDAPAEARRAGDRHRRQLNRAERSKPSERGPGDSVSQRLPPVGRGGRPGRVGRGRRRTRRMRRELRLDDRRLCILNTSCSIDHDCRLGDYVSLAPQTSGGNVEIGDYAAICLAPADHPSYTHRPHRVIGPGSTVLEHVPCRVTAYGTPARIIRPRRDQRRLPCYRRRGVPTGRPIGTRDSRKTQEASGGPRTMNNDNGPAKPARIYISPPHMSAQDRELLLRRSIRTGSLHGAASRGLRNGNSREDGRRTRGHLVQRHGRPAPGDGCC